jgi:RNA polymerase sigma factor (sigma-70 family)
MTASTHRLLTSADETRLARRIERGDAAARDELIMANLGLVHAIARDYQGAGVAFEDLVQEGAIGLAQAAERFDHRRERRFATYAGWWIRGAMRDALGGARTIRIPPSARRQIAAMNRARSELRRDGTSAPSDDDIARRAGLSPRTVRALHAPPHVTASLDEPLGEDATPLSDVIADVSEPDVPRHASDRETTKEVRSMLRLLPERQREVVLRRYGLRDGDPESHAQISARLGVGEERSRQLERQALQRLREIANGLALAA